MESLKIGAERTDLQSGDVLGQIKPVRANVGHAAGRAASLGVYTPVPIRIVKQPVLKVCTLHNKNFPEIPSLAHGAHLLHHGIETQIVANAIAQSTLSSKRDQFLPSSMLVASGFSQITCLPA